MEETYRYAAVPVDEETVREQGFTKRSLPVILFAILFATLVFIGVPLRTRAYETASSRSHLLRIYDMLTPQFPPDSSINVTIDYVPDNSALRIFSPGRLVLRSASTPSLPAPDPCLFAEHVRAHMLPRVAAVSQRQPKHGSNSCGHGGTGRAAVPAHM